MSTLGPADLHDAILEDVRLTWATAEADFSFLLSEALAPAGTRAMLHCRGVDLATLPHRLPWGRSSQVNAVVVQHLSQGCTAQVEMQSGDVLEVRCATAGIDLVHEVGALVSPLAI